jgi:phosphate transport system permease protein
MALEAQQQVVYATKRELNPETMRLEPRQVKRVELWQVEGSGAAFEPMREALRAVENDLPAMMQPNWTFYYAYILDSSPPGHVIGGVGPELQGTLMITLITILVALPLGVIAAAYLVEFGGDNVVVRTIRMCINTLAGVPSIVFGLFGLAFFVIMVFNGKPSMLTGSLTLAVLVLPIVIRASEEAIRSVPQSYREASLGLGAGRLRCFLTVTLPAALPGILTGVILAMSRAAGETAPLLFTGAVATGPRTWWPMDTTRTLAYGAYDVAVNDRLAKQVPHQQYGMVTTLIVLVLLLNISAILIRSRVSRKLRGG